MFNQSTLFHNITPDDFLSQLKEVIAEIVAKNSEQMKNEKHEELLTIEETALYFKKSIDTIDNWSKKGYLQKYGIGNSVYFKRSEIENGLTPLNPNKD
jgi:hypothetical protein